VTNTYADDFFEVEINETDLYNIPEETISPSVIEDEIF